MRIDRRSTLRLLGSALAAPFVLRPDDAQAAITIKKLGKPIPLGATQPGGKSNVALSAFDNAQGGFIAAWLNTRKVGDVVGFVRKYRNNGTPLSAEIRMGGGSGPTDGNPCANIVPVAFPDGTSLIVFAASRNNAANAHHFDIFVQRMAANFQKVGDPLPVNTKLAGLQSAVLATRLKNGNVQVVWESLATNFVSSLIRGRVIGSNGQPVAPERTVIKHSNGFNTPRALAALPGGGSVLSYTRIAPAPASPAGGDGGLAGESQWLKAFQEVKALGEPKGDPVVLDSSPVARPFGAADVVAFDDRLFVSHFRAPAAGNKAPLNLRSYWLAGFTKIGEAKVGTISIDPAYQHAPRTAAYQREQNDITEVILAHLHHPNPNVNGPINIDALVAQPNGKILAAPTPLASTDANSMTCDSLKLLFFDGGDQVEFVTGISFGNTATDSKAQVLRVAVDVI